MEQCVIVQYCVVSKQCGVMEQCVIVQYCVVSKQCGVMEQCVIVQYCVVSKHRMSLCDEQLDVVMMTVFSIV
jgi:acyl-[acyl carrier protein]--UDP-N-acetylglucosamine O-acyltransferase